MNTIQDTIQTALGGLPVKAKEATSPAIQIAVARIQHRDKASKWRYALKLALAKGSYTFTQIQAMLGKFDVAVAQTGGDFERAFVNIVDEFGNSDAQAELVNARASFLMK